MEQDLLILNLKQDLPINPLELEIKVGHMVLLNLDTLQEEQQGKDNNLKLNYLQVDQEFIKADIADNQEYLGKLDLLQLVEGQLEEPHQLLLDIKHKQEQELLEVRL